MKYQCGGDLFNHCYVISLRSAFFYLFPDNSYTEHNNCLVTAMTIHCANEYAELGQDSNKALDDFNPNLLPLIQ